MQKKAEVRWSPSADRDLGNAHEYLQKRNPSAARKLMAAVIAALDRLEQFPEIGAVATQLEPEGAYRQVVLRPYLLVGRVADDVVWILRFRDTRRDPLSLTVGHEEP